MTGIELYSTNAASNNSAVPNGWPEGQSPSSVNDCARQMMAAIRTWYETAEWIDYGYTPTYISSTSFSVTGDKTTTFQVGRRIKAYGTTPFTIYGTIATSAYASVTTVTVTWDSGSMDGTLASVWVGACSVTNPSLTSSAVKGYVSIPFTAASSSGPASLDFAEDTDNGSNKVTVKAASSLASDYTVTLPSATGTLLTDAAAITVAQGGTGLTTLTANNVILGNGTSTPSFVAPGTSGNILTSNGTTWASAAPASVFTLSYTSSDQTITAAGSLTLAHSLGVAPKIRTYELICQSTEAGFSAGDVVEVTCNNNTQVERGFSQWSDATNINIRYGTAASTFQTAHKTTGTQTSLTNGNWKLRIRAWA